MIPPLYSVSLSFRINGDRPQGQKQVKKISPSSTSGATRCDRLSIFLQSLCLQISRTLHIIIPHHSSSDSDLKPKFKTKDTNFLREPPTAIASMQAPRRFAFAQYLVRSGDETCFPSPSTALSESAGAQITCGDVGPDFNSVIGYMLNLCWLYMPDFSTVIPAHLPQLEYTATRNTRWDGVMSVFCALPVLCGVTLGFHHTARPAARSASPKTSCHVQSPWNQSTHSTWNPVYIGIDFIMSLAPGASIEFLSDLKLKESTRQTAPKTAVQWTVHRTYGGTASLTALDGTERPSTVEQTVIQQELTLPFTCSGAKLDDAMNHSPAVSSLSHLEPRSARFTNSPSSMQFIKPLGG
ncbi:hypothetical protein B0H14DRAFT_2593662 [Mycena olivaceomarginata]|nr:hypothetical protein B0H14DRAFT_2593662 [Mycena olivaceomarginata]